MSDTITITLPGIVFMCVSAASILVLERKYIFIPVLLSSLYVTQGQVIIVGGLHFFLFRALVLVCWIRILFRGEIQLEILNPIDKTIIVWALVKIIMNTILWGTYESFKTEMGYTYDIFGLYGFFRLIIIKYDDIELIFKAMSIIIIPLSLLMVYESRTGINLYSYFGGVPESSVVRDGWVRCQGPFRQAILAGTFGATSVPLFVALYLSKEANKFISILGIISSVIIVFVSKSSGPLIALISVIIAFLCWGFRDRMKFVRWGILFSIIFLHIFMKDPVWYIMDRIGGIFGGGGWHRAYLIDRAVVHFNEWWLIGTKSTANWMPYGLAINPDAADITNAYIGNGVEGGLISMVFFIFIIMQCFRGLGKAQKLEVPHPFGKRICVWVIGSALFAHVVSFLSISYFDQSVVFWYMLLAIISSITDIHKVWEFDISQIEQTPHLQLS